MTAALRQGGALYGTAMAVLGTLAFTVNDMLIKAMSGDYALHQVTLMRAVGACLFLFGLAMPLMGGRAALRIGRVWMHVWRGLLVVVANGLFFMGLASLPLAEGTAIFSEVKGDYTGVSDPGMPRVRIVHTGAFSSVRIHTLAPGEAKRKWWHGT